MDAAGAAAVLVTCIEATATMTPTMSAAVMTTMVGQAITQVRHTAVTIAAVLASNSVSEAVGNNHKNGRYSKRPFA